MNKQLIFFFLLCIVPCMQLASPTIDQHARNLKKQRAIAKQPSSINSQAIPPNFNIFPKEEKKPVI
jgi:hypothetical protein